MSCGGHHTALLTQTGKVLVCGSSAYGQIGQKHLRNYNKLRQLKVFSRKRVLKIACGWNHTLVLCHPHFVYSAGLNKYGELGLVSFEMRRNFTLIESLIGKNVIDVFAGGYHSWFLLNGGQTTTEFNPPSPLAESEADSVSDKAEAKSKYSRDQSQRKANSFLHRKSDLESGHSTPRKSHQSSSKDIAAKGRKSFLPADKKPAHGRSLLKTGTLNQPPNEDIFGLAKTTSLMGNVGRGQIEMDLLDGDILDFEYRRPESMTYQKREKVGTQQQQKGAKTMLDDHEENLLRNSSKKLQKIVGEENPSQNSKYLGDFSLDRQPVLYQERSFKRETAGPGLGNDDPRVRRLKVDFTASLKDSTNKDSLFENPIAQNVKNFADLRPSPDLSIQGRSSAESEFVQAKDNIFKNRTDSGVLDEEDESGMLNSKLKAAVAKQSSIKANESKNSAQSDPSSIIKVNYKGYQEKNSIHSNKNNFSEDRNSAVGRPTDRSEPEFETFKNRQNSSNERSIKQERYDIFRHEKTERLWDNTLDFYLVFAKLDYCHRFAIIFSDKRQKAFLSRRVNDIVNDLKANDPKIIISSFVTSDEFELRKTNNFIEQIVSKQDDPSKDSHILMMISSCKNYENQLRPFEATKYSNYSHKKSDIGEIYSISEEEVMMDARQRLLCNWYLKIKSGLTGVVESIQFMELRSTSYQ